MDRLVKFTISIEEGQIFQESTSVEGTEIFNMVTDEHIEENIEMIEGSTWEVIIEEYEVEATLEDPFEYECYIKDAKRLKNVA